MRFSIYLEISFQTRWIKNNYDDPEIFIVENGSPDEGGLVDDDRIAYLHDHLKQVLDVVLNDKVNVKGYSGSEFDVIDILR